MSSQPQSKYDNVPLEDHDEAGSHTEVEESLLGDEKKWNDNDFQRPQRQSTQSRIISALRSGVNTLLLLAILGLVLRQQLQTTAKNLWDFGGDFTGFAPAFSQKITTFNMEYKYQRENTSEFFSDEVMHAWNDIMPSMCCSRVVPYGHTNMLKGVWASNRSTILRNTTTCPRLLSGLIRLSSRHP